MKKEVRDFIDKHIGKGAGINDKDNRGKTALVKASYLGNVAIEELLINAGAKEWKKKQKK